MRIRPKITIVNVISFLILTLLLDWFISSKITETFNNRLVDKARKISYLVENTEQDGILNENLFGRLSRFVEVQSTDKEVKGISIFKSFDNVFASNLNNLLSYNETFNNNKELSAYGRNDSIFFFISPVKSLSVVEQESFISCHILIELYTQKFDAKLSEILSTLRYTILFVSIFILVLILFFAESIVKSLVQLTIEAKIIASGDYNNTIEVNRKDELGILGKALNDMRENIASSTEKIIKFNKKISDSILYAETIQNALLPKDEFFEKHFEDYFHFYRPKDIVSGDFYWKYKDEEGNIFLCVGDCTGHGVSGAFMTMIANALLNQIVGVEKLRKPNEILDRLRDRIIDTLNKEFEKSDSQLTHGMDLSFCIIDVARENIEFAGAMNPIVIISSNELKYYASDKQPLGLTRKMKPFINQNIQISKGDQMYMFTDGFIDQFGGPKYKRYKRAKFLELLSSVSEYSMDKQKQIVVESFNNWKGQKEQIDDILVLGIKF